MRFKSKKSDIPDWRNIATGNEIPSEYYSDQPYVVIAEDGAWVCCMTTGDGAEGALGQHIVTMRSLDKGKTWIDIVEVESPESPESSYAVMLKAGVRIYIFYNYNKDNLRAVKTDSGGSISRVDSLGYYVFKYSDDNGKAWSENRYYIDVREFEIDRNNVYGGKIRFFWNVGKPFVIGSCAYMSLHKVANFGAGFFTGTQGVLLKSDNILYEKDPDKITFVTLPDGDIGLHAPEGKISEEQSYVVLSDNSIYSVYRTVDGYPVECYSRDLGHTFEKPQAKYYATVNAYGIANGNAIGMRMKHPRAANFVWKTKNGKYLYWFHNHGGKDYEDRNPAWLSAGTEIDGDKGKIIAWSQPEILLYDDDPFVRISYPDLIEEDGRYFITETQKNIARIHEIPADFINILQAWDTISTIAQKGLIFEKDVKKGDLFQIKMPVFLVRGPHETGYGAKDLRQGCTLEFKITPHKDREYFSNMDANGRGFSVKAGENGSLEIYLSDGQTHDFFITEADILRDNGPTYISIIIDGGPKIIMVIVNGKLCDGNACDAVNACDADNAEERQFGWGRFSPCLKGISGGDLHILSEEIENFRIYSRALMVTEAIGNYKNDIKCFIV